MRIAETTESQNRKPDPALSWDYENRLTQASRSGLAVNYMYDALGRRIQVSSTASGITRFVYNGADVVRDLDGNGSTLADYLNGPGIDDKLRQTAGGTVSYFLTDHLGTTRALTDASGNVTSTLDYDSFGKVTSGLAQSRYSYTGREAESDVWLMYYRARWYDPQMGRFISEDPIGFRGRDINFYGYVHNDPLRLIDPTGLRRCNPILGGIVGGLLGAGVGGGAGAVLGAVAGGTIGGAGGTLVVPGFGTIAGAGSGVAVGAGAGAFFGSAIGAAAGIVAGINHCNADDACSEPQAPTAPFPTPQPTPLFPPFTPNNLDKDDECYEKCKHLLGLPGDYSNRFIKCYRQCKGTL